MGLLNKMRKELDKTVGAITEEYIPSYSTGIDLIDYMNGYMSCEGELMLGVRGGRLVQIVGPSGSGKSTLAIQIACNIVKDYDSSDVIHLDYEKAASKERIMSLANWDNETYEEKYQIKQLDLTGETLYTLIKEIEKLKKENRESIILNSGKTGRDGKPIMIYPPTVVIVDSVAMMAPKDIEEDDELRGSMGASAIAKFNTNLFKRIVGSLANVNIILILVNHLNQKVEIGPVKSKVSLNYLGQDETIPGGRALSYISDTLISLTPSTKFKDNEGLKITGFELKAKLIKSRNSEAGQEVVVVYEQKSGINNLLTNFNILKNAKRINVGAFCKFPEWADTSFRQADFAAMYSQDDKLKRAFDKAVKEELSKLINPVNNVTNDEYKLIDSENNVYQKDDKYFIIENGKYVEVEYN